MQISARRYDKTTIFDLSGDIDFANSPEVRQPLLREIRENRTPRVVVNLSQVRYIDSVRAQHCRPRDSATLPPHQGL